MSNISGLGNNGLLTGHKDDSRERTNVTASWFGIQRVARPRPAGNQVGRECGCLIANLPITIAGFVVAVTGFS